MIYETIVNLSAFTILSLATNLVPLILPSQAIKDQTLAIHQFSLEKRYYPVQKENILLNLAYMDGSVKSKSDINWDNIQRPRHFEFRLEPNQTFAFHDAILPEYTGKIAKTTNAHFNSQEGFRSAGYLIGDGVCHLASLIYWVALDAGLEAKAPTNHNFMAIPEIDRKYGVSIYSNPNGSGDAKQNLYITNNKQKPVVFNFSYIDGELTTSVVEVN